MPLREDQLLWEVEEQHLDEAEFLFELWEAVLDAPNYTLDEIAEGPQRRLLAHVDALSLAGPLVAERLLFPVIEDEHRGSDEVAAATLAVGPDAPAELRERALAALDLDGGQERRAGLIRGLQLHSNPRLDDDLLRSVSAAKGRGLAARLEVLAGRQVVVGSWLARHLAGGDLEVTRAAGRLARHCREPAVLEGLGPLAQSDDPQLRRVTLETALCRGMGGAWESAAYWAFGAGDAAGDAQIRGDALVWVALLGDAAAHERLLELVDDPQRRAEALWALGFGGRVAAVDRGVALLDDEEHAALAGELVCAIAGLPTDEETMWREPAREQADEALPELEAEDLEADLVPTGTDALPLPDPPAVAAWWAEQRGRFDPGLRYLGGRPLDEQVLLEALAGGPARRRHTLALELAMRTHSRAFVPTRALAERQRAALARAAELGAIDCQRGLPLR